MSNLESQINVIAPTEEASRVVHDILRGIPGMRITAHTGTLTGMNGTAVKLSKMEGILIAQFAADQIADLEAIEGFAKSEGTRAKLIVLSDPDMPLSTARRLLQSGVDEVLPTPVDSEELRKAIQRLSRPAQLPAVWTGQIASRVISVTRARGGIGATTVAVNLAHALAAPKGGFRKSPGARVALVDLDLQFGSVASFLDVPPRDTLYDIAIDNIVPDMDFLENAMEIASDGVHVLGAPSRFLPLDGLKPEQVGAMIDALKTRYDYVVVDLPHSLVDWVQAVIDRSDRMLLVTDSTVPSIRQSKRLIDFFRDETPGLPIEVVINYEAKPLVRAKHHTQAAKLLEQPFRTWLPPDPKTAREALDRGVPLAAASRRSPLTRSINAFAKTMQDDFASPTAAAKRH